MNIGVWMSRGVLEHKREVTDTRGQVWNVGVLPDKFARGEGPNLLFVAVDRYWRGFFVLTPEVLCNARDQGRPYTLIFAPESWTPIEPLPAPHRSRGKGYTLQVPPSWYARR
jgi:hypothetical protein